MNIKKIGTRILLILAIALVLLIGAAVYFFCKNPNPDRPASIDHPTGFVQAVGTNLYDGDGNLFLLKGINLGNWFVQENYMSVVSVDNYDTGNSDVDRQGPDNYHTQNYTQKRALEAMRANPNLTEDQIESLEQIYMETYITEDDFSEIASLGLNTVRIPFTYMNFTTDQGTLRENAFQYLDWALEMCEKYGLYAILDLHGAFGSQNQDMHSGDDSQFALYGNPENREKTIQLWETLAARYKDRTVVAGYDLLNEPRKAPGKFGGKINTDFYDELYQAVRSIDQNHMIFIEYFTFPIHGLSTPHYNWENICAEYHIYNLSPFSQTWCLRFYKALHNFTGNNAPVLIGEWNAWNDAQDWYDSMEYFEDLGWSYASWAYKSNSYSYRDHEDKRTNWGVYQLYAEPVDVSTATYEEIADAYRKTATEYAEKSLVYEVYDTWFE